MDTILDCGHPESPHSEITRGFATLRVHTGAERRICYACAAECDKYEMTRHGVITLYLIGNTKSGHKVTNWPGSLSFPARDVRHSELNAFGGRIDRVTARFTGPDGAPWWIDVRGNMECGTARRCAS
jgi:hypothetical protein